MVNKEEVIEQLKEVLNSTEEDTRTLSFATDTDESAVFPHEVEGWVIVNRESRFVPKHYMNSATYSRKVEKVVQNEEAQS